MKNTGLRTLWALAIVCLALTGVSRTLPAAEQTSGPAPARTALKANAVPTENVLVSWNGIPSLDVLKALPQSRR